MTFFLKKIQTLIKLDCPTGKQDKIDRKSTEDFHKIHSGQRRKFVQGVFGTDLSIKKNLRAAKALTKHTLGPIYLPQAGLSQKTQFDNIKTEKDARTLKKMKYYNRGSSAWEED